MRWSEFGGLIVYYHVHNQYFSPLGAFFGSGRGSSAHLFLGRSCRQTILGTLRLLNFDWRLMGVILTFLPCKVPSNFSPHKDLSHFPSHLSSIYFSGMSTLLTYRLCQNVWKLIWISGISIDFLTPFWRHFRFNLDRKVSDYNTVLSRLMSLSNFVNWSRGFYMEVQCQGIHGDKKPFWCSITLFN